jgi:hypothetical protein
MFQECRHVKTNGLKCKSPALRGMPYCYFHARLHRAAKGPKPLKITSLETAKDVRAALAMVLARPPSSPRDARQTEFYLWALQIASQNVSRNQPGSKPGTAVSPVRPEQPANSNSPNRKLVASS